MQKWFLMTARSLVDVECCIDLSGLGGAHQEFGQFAWFHIEDMLPLCRDFKRGAYAHVIREMQPMIAVGQKARSKRHSRGMNSCNSPEPLKASDAAERHHNHESSETKALAAAVQGNSLDYVVKFLVKTHGMEAVKRAVDGLESPGGWTLDEASPREEEPNEKSCAHEAPLDLTQTSTDLQVQQDKDTIEASE